jgi:hypothetical protein
LRSFLEDAYRREIAAELERSGLTEDELTVIGMLADNPAPHDCSLLETSYRMDNPFSNRRPMFREPIARLKYLGYLRKLKWGFTLSDTGIEMAHLRAGWLPVSRRRAGPGPAKSGASLESAEA